MIGKLETNNIDTIMNNRYKNIELTEQISEATCVTHSGKFHVDDIISTIFLSKILKKVVLVRIASTENKNLKNKIVYDIGFGEFDHHQKNRNGQRENGIYYSSIGLLWKKFGKKYLESLNVKSMQQNHYIAKCLIENPISEIIRVLKYKALWNNKKLIQIDKYYPSSQICNICGYQNRKIKDLSIRSWECPQCGCTHDRDLNAATNIMLEGLKKYMLQTTNN